MSTNQGLIQWREFNTTVKRKIHTLYDVRLKPAEVMRFCVVLKSFNYYPSQTTIDDASIRQHYDLWRLLSLEQQIDYLNLLELGQRIDIDEDPVNVMN